MTRTLSALVLFLSLGCYTPRGAFLEVDESALADDTGYVISPGDVLQALAASGGLTDFAHRDGLFVLRKIAGQPAPRRLRFTFEVLARGEGPAARFTLLPGDVVVAE